MKKKFNRFLTALTTVTMILSSYGPQFVLADGEDGLVSEEIVSEDDITKDVVSDDEADAVSEDMVVADDIDVPNYIEAEDTVDDNKNEEEQSDPLEVLQDEKDSDEAEGFVCADYHETAPALIERLKALDASLNDEPGIDMMAPGAPSTFGTGISLCPSEGVVHPFIAMVDFEDVKFDDEFTPEYVENIFFAEEGSDTYYDYPFDSLSAWYKRSSYGKLNFIGNMDDILQIHIDKTREYYTDTEETGCTKEVELNNIAYEKIKKSITDMSRYDSDNDGSIDALCIIFAGKAGDWSSQWWSCVYGIASNQLFVHLMEEHIKVDSTGGLRMTSAIHEFGHLLGLPDLYSTTTNGDKFIDGIHTGDMMSDNVGGFNALCKMMLGWIDEDNIIIKNKSSESSIVEINGYPTTGQCVLLSLEDELSSIFGEYFLVQYEDLNGNDTPVVDVYDDTFLRIYHVNATLTESGNGFKYSNNYNGNCRLIWLVDNDAHVLHGATAIGTASIYDYVDLVAGNGNGYGCGFHSGSKFTPYTAPSTMKYAETGKMADGGDFSGLFVDNITISEEQKKATFEVYYEDNIREINDFQLSTASPYYSNKSGNDDIVDTASPKFYLRGNHEFFMNDESKKAYIREKDGEMIGYLVVDLVTPFNVIGYDYDYQNYYTLYAYYDGELEANKQYELVFPAGQLKTIAGVINEDTIVTGLNTGNESIEKNTVVFNKEGYSGYANTWDIDWNGIINHAVVDGYNVTIPVNIQGKGIAICTINGKTGELISEKVFFEDKNVTDSGIHKYTIIYFGKTANGKYFVDFRIEKDIFMILNSDWEVEWKKEWDRDLVIGQFSDGFDIIGNKVLFRGGIIDTDSLTYTEIKYDGNPYENHWEQILSFGEYYLCQFLSSNPVVLSKEINTVASIEGLNYTWIKYTEKINEGYLIMGEEEHNIVKYILDNDFNIINRCILKDNSTVVGILPLKTGYLLSWRYNNTLYRSGIYDKNFHKKYEISLFSGAATEIDENECVCYISSRLHNNDYGEDLIIGYSDSMNITSEKHDYGAEIITPAVSDGDNSKNGSIKSVCSICGDEQITVIPYAKDFTVKGIKIVENKYQADIAVVDVKGNEISTDQYTVDISEKNQESNIIIIKVILKDKYSGKLEKEVLSIRTTSVSVSPNSVELTVGETKALTAIVTPKDATDKSVSWNSSKPSVATVDESGVITAVSAGEAMITVKTTDGGYTATCKVKVNPAVISVTRVSVSPNSVELTVGETKALTVTVTPDDATDKSVSWNSSKPSVATVDESGVITAVSAGEATITVKTTDGGYTAICKVKVNPAVIAVSGVSVSPNSVELTVGDTEDLTATVTPADATDKSVSWNSSAPSVATVDEDGMITAVAAGTATITVTTTDGGFTAGCEVTVKEETVSDNTVSVTGVTLSDTELELNVGETELLTATISPDDATDKSVSWSSSDPSVATVSSNGLVTAIAAGEATVTVTTTDGGFTASCEVTVNEERDEIYAELVDGDTYMYTGSKITPAVEVYNGDEELVEGVDYKVSYINNLNAGTAKVTITGKILAFELEHEFTIEAVDISDEELVKGSDVIMIQKGAKATPVLYYGSYKLTAKDYKVLGESTFTEDGELEIEGKGNFAGTRTFDVEIGKPEKIKVKMIGKPSFIYDGEEHMLTEDEDYEVDGSYEIIYPNDIVNAGTVKVRFIGIDEYSGTVTKTYKILPDKDANVTVSLAQDTMEYDALGAYPAVTVKKDDGTELIAGKDYTLSYSGNKAVTENAKVNVKFIGNYKGVKNQSMTFKITAAALNEVNADVYCANLAYTKAGKYLSVPYVNVGNVALTKKDYTVAYFIGERDITKAKITDSDFGSSDTIDVTVKITLGGKKNPKYSGTLTGSYTITKTDKDHDLSKAKVKLMKNGKVLKSFAYTGKPIELGDDVKVVVTIGKKKTVVPASEFEIHYSNNLNKGKAAVIVTAKEGSSYHGSKATSFKIVKGKIKWN